MKMDLYSDYWPLSNEGLVLALRLFLPPLSLALAVDSCPGLRSRANTSSIPSLFLRSLLLPRLGNSSTEE